MNKLPNEILNFVFQDLHLFQKQECMLVCSRWSNILRSTSFFSTVHISSADMYDRLTKILDDNPSYRYQIQSLTTHGDFFVTINENQLLHYFPSVRFIHSKSLNILPLNASELNKDLLVNLSNWRNQIEKIEMPWNRPDNNLFSLGVFSGLKKLVVSWIDFPISLPDIISRAPNISVLVILEARISLNDLKLIHAGLKALQHLALEKAELMAGGELNGTDITNSLTTLFISILYPSEDTIVTWLQYINKTCTQLRHFRFIFPWASNSMSQQELFITHNGFVTLLQNLGHQLKYIEINSSDEILTILNTLRTLNNDKQIFRISTKFSGLRLSFENPQLWNQGRFIHQITLTIDSVTPRTISYLGFIKTLKKLKIGYLYQHGIKNRTVCLNSLLYNCSDSLETLEVYNFNIDFHDTLFRSHPLKALAIHNNSISKRVYRFISTYLPNLKHLTIDQRSSSNSGTIMLNSRNLQSLDISINYDGFIMIKTLSDHLSHYYPLGTYKMSEFQSVELIETQSQCLTKRATVKQAEDSRIVVQLICNSIESLTINKRIAF